MTIRQWNRLKWLLSRWTSTHGIETAACLAGKAEAKAAFAKIEAALNLIQQYDPRRMAYLQRDMKRILIWGSPDYQGAWHQQDAMCELDSDFVRSPKTTPAILASTLVHEAMHARLMRWGFGYEEDRRVRIESICIKASINFARRLPLSEMASRGEIISTARRKLEYDQTFWSDEGRLAAKAAALIALGCPEWLAHFVLKVGLARLCQYRRNVSRKDNGSPV